MVKVRSLERVQFSRYLCLCNVLRICNIRAIPTYRVYRLYDRVFLGTFYVAEPDEINSKWNSNPSAQSSTALEAPRLTIWPRFYVHSLCGFCFDKSIFDNIFTAKVKLKK